MTKTVTIYGDRTEHAVTFPSRWAVCPSCEGEGKTSQHLGAFTASEWEEQDDEFREEYLAGRYDRACENCKGRTTISVIDEEKLTRWQKKLLAEYRRQCADFRELDGIEAAERRMGA
jgi:DnaJ-class molecular chaperone